MKIIFLVSFVISSIAMASGSYDIMCAEQRGGEERSSPVRYHFHQGEEWELDIFKVAGVNEKETFEQLVKYNPLKLEAWDIQRMVTRKNELKFKVCQVDDQKYDEEGTCEKEWNATTVKLTSRVGKNQHGMKRFYITAEAEGKEGTKSTLKISQHGESDSGEDFSGTLLVESGNAAWPRSGEIKINCQVSTP